MIFAWNFLRFTRFFEGLQSDRPLFEMKQKKKQPNLHHNAKSLACSPAKIQLKDIPALVCKNYIFWLVHASIPFKGKVRNLWIFSCAPSRSLLSDLYEFQLVVFRWWEPFSSCFCCECILHRLDLHEYECCVQSVRRTGFQIAVQLAYKKNYLLQTLTEIKSFH